MTLFAYPTIYGFLNSSAKYGMKFNVSTKISSCRVIASDNPNESVSFPFLANSRALSRNIRDASFEMLYILLDISYASSALPLRNMVLASPTRPRCCSLIVDISETLASSVKVVSNMLNSSYTE